MKYFLLFLGLFIYAGAILATFAMPIDDSLLFVFLSIIASLLIVYNAGFRYRLMLTVSLVVVYLSILSSQIVRIWNSIEIDTRTEEEKHEKDRVLLIPANYQGCIHVIYPPHGDSYIGKCTTIVTKTDKKVVPIKDTIIVDKFGLATCPLTQMGSSWDYEFYLVDTNKKARRIQLLKGGESVKPRHDQLPTIVGLFTVPENEIYDYRGDSVLKTDTRMTNFYLYNKDTCSCKSSTEGTNIDSMITEYVKKMGTKKKIKRTAN